MNTIKEIQNLQPDKIFGDDYEGVLTLPSWTGFQSRQGCYASKDKLGESDGAIKIRIIDGVKTTTTQQVNAIKFLIDNSDKIRNSILDTFIKELPNLREIYEDLIPKIEHVEDLKNVIGLSLLHIMPSDKDDYAYIGFEFGCNWDEEHGVGVMTHKDRVIAFGGADTSFDSWVTYEDNGTKEIEKRKYMEFHVQLQEEQKKIKPWWKFWSKI